MEKGNGDHPTARDMVINIEKALFNRPPGATSITIEGMSVALSPEAALQELSFWKKQAEREGKGRPVVIKTKLG